MINATRAARPLIEYIPLQQGLRQVLVATIDKVTLLIEYIPLQQGLRQVLVATIDKVTLLIEYIPLQQGLRRLAPLLIRTTRTH